MLTIGLSRPQSSCTFSGTWLGGMAIAADNAPYPPISGSRRDVPAAPMFAMEEIAIGQELEGNATADIPAA